MQEVIKLIREERQSLEALLQENSEKCSKEEIRLLHNKKLKLAEVEAKIKEYNNIH